MTGMTQDSDNFSYAINALIGKQVEAIAIGRYIVNITFNSGAILSAHTSLSIRLDGAEGDCYDIQSSLGNLKPSEFFRNVCTQVDVTDSSILLCFGKSSVLEISREIGQFENGTANIDGRFYIY